MGQRSKSQGEEVIQISIIMNESLLSSGDNIVAACFTVDSNKYDTFIFSVQGTTTTAVEKEDIMLLQHQDERDEKEILLQRHSSEEIEAVHTGTSIPSEIFCGGQSCYPSAIFDVIFPNGSPTKANASSSITSSPPVSPGYQKRGRFLVWPASPVAVTDETTNSRHSVSF
jgi:hypothetical protein